jgi:endo-1,4-beta-xylanase
MPIRRRALLAAGLSPAAARAQEAAGQGGPEGTPRLGALAAARGILFGTTLTQGQVAESPEMRRIAAREAAVIVPGLELKWAGCRPAPDRFDFGPAEALAGFAAAHGQRLRGHALVWHEALPAWFGQGPAEPTAMRALLQTHIATVAGHFAGRMQSWDVVNEPIEPWYRRADGLRETPFLRALGPGYIDLAFQLAAAADPAATLVLNEFDLELAVPQHAARRQALLRLLEGMKARGVPVQAVGIQAHLSADRLAQFDPAVLRGFIRRIAALGLEVYVTELDVTDRGLPADLALRDAAVARMFGAFLGAALAEPAVRLVVLWGISDRYTWINDSRFARREDGLPVRAHPYDEGFRPKPARAAIAEAFAAAPPR